MRYDPHVRSSLAPLAFTLALAACGGQDPLPLPGSNTCVDPFDEHAEPPAPAVPSASATTGHVTFAISRLFIGDTDREGKPTFGAWASYGYDLDGISSLACADQDPPTLCRPRDGADATSVHTDGDEGRDNSFGKHLAAFFVGMDSHFTESMNARLAAGGATLLVDIDGLGVSPSVGPLTARLHATTSLPTAPLYDGSDAFPIRPELLDDPANAATALLHTEDSYVADDVWVGRFAGDLPIDLTFDLHETRVRVVIHDPVITMRLDIARARVTLGTLAGVVSAEALSTELGDAYYRLLHDSFVLCSTAAHDDVVESVLQAADMPLDGVSHPESACDGISIGLGFKAEQATLGPIAEPETPLDPPPPCDTTP
jgi:predicted small lipoprotein YifL